MASSQVLLFLAAVLLSSFPGKGNGNEDIAPLSTTLRKVQQEIVNKHNALRRSVSPSASDMLKMEWSAESAARAQQWANRCIYGHSSREFRKINISCGENLYMSSRPIPWSQAIQSWYDEHNNFEYAVGPKPTNAVVGHYTQIVWNTSFRVGCAIAYCPQQFLKFFMVCHYCPAGNQLRRLYRPYTKGEPCAKCPNHCDNGLCTNSCDKEDVYSNCSDLKKSLSCDNTMVKESCKATCNCEDKIH
uniref:Cysteine-rich secretory protein 3 n=1 Tax=Jaculus jaculus TaxID=51337 RepID=A0A8C5P3D0_JACJA